MIYVKNKLSSILIIVALLFLCCNSNSFAQSRIRNLLLERHEVFDTLDGDWFFAAGIANLLHTNTKDYIIEDELLFGQDDEIIEYLLAETEKNLRKLDLFSKVNIKLDSIGNGEYDVIIMTKDKWSLQPSAYYATAGGNASYGAKFAEKNLFGHGIIVGGEAQYRQENDIGWQASATFNKIRPFRQDLNLNYELTAHQFRTKHIFDLTNPYRSFYDETAYGVSAYSDQGNDFLYSSFSNSFTFLPTNTKQASLFFSKAWIRKDKVFITGLLDYQTVDRGDKKYSRAFDNTGKLLMQFSSVSKEFTKLTKVNNYLDEDVPLGGYGSAILGKLFPIGSKDGDNLYYIAGEGEVSRLETDYYLFGHIAAGSGFYQSDARYTYQEFNGLAFYKPSENVLIAGRLFQQSTWNWDKSRQLILDAETGLRGYNLNQFIGDNRIIANLESRFFTDYQLWIFNFSGVAFFDIGSVWDRGTDLTKSRFYSSIGLGFRLHNNKATGGMSTLRFDFAYNLEQRKIGFVITTDQMFSAWGKHEFRKPALLGTQFDTE